MDAERAAALAGIGLLSFALSFLGAAVGLVLGHLRLVALIAYLGSPLAGVTTNLAVSGLGAAAGTCRHARGGRVNARALLLMGLPSALGVLLGTALLLQLNPLWSSLVVGTVLAVSGVSLLRPTAEAPRAADWFAGAEAVVGLGLGGLTALTGLMLGSLRLPVMVGVFGLDARTAAGTNLAVGFLTAAVGTAAAWAAGGGCDPVTLAALAPPTMLGSYAGGWLTGRLSQRVVKGLAGVLVALSGVVMLGQGAARLAAADRPEAVAVFVAAEGEEAAEDDRRP